MTNEKKLTEFEKRFIELIRLWRSGNTNPEENLTQSQFDAKELLDLARKELEENYYTKVLDDRTVFKSELHATDLQTAYDMGKQDALKDLPKWKKAEKGKLERLFDERGALEIMNGDVYIVQCVTIGDFYIPISELLTLPKKE